ncbi:MAG: DUF1810 domain-containing protein [Chitinophagaceae bacterium]
MNDKNKFSEIDNDLRRFLQAQQNIYPQVLKELQSGKKTSHWMWFIFPQIEGLGHSSTAKYYSIKTIEEAKEYLGHPILGNRLLQCSNIIVGIENKNVDEIFGYPDNMKLRSCMTLFNFISPEQRVFADVLEKYFSGEEDGQTLSILQNA